MHERAYAACDASCTIWCACACVCIHLLATTFYSTLYCKHSIILISFRVFFRLFFFSCCVRSRLASMCIEYTLLSPFTFRLLFSFSIYFFRFCRSVVVVVVARFRLPSQNILSFRALALPQHTRQPLTVMAERSNVCLIHHKKSEVRYNTLCLFSVIFIHLSAYCMCDRQLK